MIFGGGNDVMDMKPGQEGVESFEPAAMVTQAKGFTDGRMADVVPVAQVRIVEMA